MGQRRYSWKEKTPISAIPVTQEHNLPSSETANHSYLLQIFQCENVYKVEEIKLVVSDLCKAVFLTEYVQRHFTKQTHKTTPA